MSAWKVLKRHLKQMCFSFTTELKSDMVGSNIYIAKIKKQYFSSGSKS